MNKKVCIIIVIIIGVCLLYYIGNLNSKKNITENSMNKVQNNINNKLSDEFTLYYEDDQTINKYISLFNNMYPNNKITRDMLSVYYHHGAEHKNQVKFIMSGFEIVLTANYTDDISIYVENIKNDDVEITNLIKNFIKVLNPNISDDKLDEYIDSQESGSNINTYDGIEFWINKNLDGTKIEYIKITGKIQN